MKQSVELHVFTEQPEQTRSCDGLRLGLCDKIFVFKRVNMLEQQQLKAGNIQMKSRQKGHRAAEHFIYQAAERETEEFNC